MLRRFAALVIAHCLSCEDRERSDAPHLAMVLPSEVASATASRDAIDSGPIRMEELRLDAGPPVFVMRGGPRGPDRFVFLHGMCGHGLGYAQAFQFAAARKGTLIAPQGDVSCGGVWSKWSMDVPKLDARITETFRALGLPEPSGEIVVMGMSQGASRAEELARRYPTRYTRLVSMASPAALKPGTLTKLRGAVFMAGERDRKDLMQASARTLERGGVPATFVMIPQATHGAMGPTPERTMGNVLDWLWGNSKPSSVPKSPNETSDNE